jgi:hypothetical protein
MLQLSVRKSSVVDPESLLNPQANQRKRAALKKGRKKGQSQLDDMEVDDKTVALPAAKANAFAALQSED